MCRMKYLVVWGQILSWYTLAQLNCLQWKYAHLHHVRSSPIVIVHCHFLMLHFIRWQLITSDPIHCDIWGRDCPSLYVCTVLGEASRCFYIKYSKSSNKSCIQCLVSSCIDMFLCLYCIYYPISTWTHPCTCTRTGGNATLLEFQSFFLWSIWPGEGTARKFHMQKERKGAFFKSIAGETTACFRVWHVDWLIWSSIALLDHCQILKDISHSKQCSDIFCSIRSGWTLSTSPRERLWPGPCMNTYGCVWEWARFRLPSFAL